MENGDVREVEKYLEKNVKKKESKKLKKYVCKKKKSVVLACASVIKFVKKIPERWKFKKIGFGYEKFLSDEDKM